MTTIESRRQLVAVITAASLASSLFGAQSIRPEAAEWSGVSQPFATLPPWSATLTPAFPPTAPRDGGIAPTPGTTPEWSLWLSDHLPSAVLGATGLLFVGAMVVTLGLQARPASALALKLVRRNIDISKLVAGIAIVFFGLVILLLGLFAVFASAAEGPFGFHGLAIGGLMVVLGAVFIYLGVRVIADAWNIPSPET